MSRTSKLRKEVARTHAWREGTGDFYFHKHVFVLMKGDQTHSAHFFEREALEYMAFSNDPELRLERTPWLLKRTVGPMFDDAPTPPVAAPKGDPS